MQNKLVDTRRLARRREEEEEELRTEELRKERELVALAELARVNRWEVRRPPLPDRERSFQEWADALCLLCDDLRYFFRYKMACGATVCSGNAFVSQRRRALGLSYIVLRVPTGRGGGIVPVYAHRLVFCRLKEELEEGNMVLHGCHKGTCLKLGCLSQGTAQDNARDRDGLSRQAKMELRREEQPRRGRQARGGRARSNCGGCGQFTSGGAPRCVRCPPPPPNGDGAPP